MITALIFIYSALLFALGVMVGKIAKKGEEETVKKPQTDYDRELLSFLNYDGSQQERK